MTDDARAQLANLLATELEAAKLRWAKKVTEFESICVGKGMFNSGARVFGTSERLSEGVIHYRQYIFDKWTAYVRPRFTTLSQSERSAFVDVALVAMDNAISDALRLFDTRSKSSIQSATPLSEPIRETGTRERQSLENELRLYMSTPTDTHPSMNVNVTTHGSGSPVNVGSGTLNQQINTAEGMGELVAALVALLDAMKDQTQFTEVRDIVIETKDEAAKPQPNKLKLRSFLGGMKTAIEGVDTLEKAWELVQQASKALGLSI